MNRTDEVLVYLAATLAALIAGVLVGNLLFDGWREPSKIEYFNIMCANQEGPTFHAEYAKSYDVRGNLLEVTARDGRTVMYEVPPHVMCVADPVTTEELLNGP